MLTVQTSLFTGIYTHTSVLNCVDVVDAATQCLCVCCGLSRSGRCLGGWHFFFIFFFVCKRLISVQRFTQILQPTNHLLCVQSFKCLSFYLRMLFAAANDASHAFIRLYYIFKWFSLQLHYLWLCVRGNIKRKLQKSLHFFCVFAIHFLPFSSSISFSLAWFTINQKYEMNVYANERKCYQKVVMCNVKVNENEDPPPYTHNHSTQFIRTPEYSIQDVKQMILCNIKWKKKKKMREKIKPKEERIEVCHFLVHEDFFIHPHFIPHFVLYITTTSCSYRGGIQEENCIICYEKRDDKFVQM